MSVRLVVLAVCAAASLLPTTALAAPPPPPPPPSCDICNGPPPPPTPVPTVAATQVAPQPLVQVHLKSPRVTRGDKAQVSIEAATDSVVDVHVRYLHRKDTVFHLKMGSSGELLKSWKVPRTTPPGRAKVTVTVHVDDATVSKSLTLVVVR